MFCLDCEESVKIEKKEQHAGGSLGKEILSRLERVEAAISGLKPAGDPPGGPPVPESALVDPSVAGQPDTGQTAVIESSEPVVDDLELERVKYFGE